MSRSQPVESVAALQCEEMRASLCRSEGHLPGPDGDDDEAGLEPDDPLLRRRVAQGHVPRRRPHDDRSEDPHGHVRGGRRRPVGVRKHAARRHQDEDAGTRRLAAGGVPLLSVGQKAAAGLDGI